MRKMIACMAMGLMSGFAFNNTCSAIETGAASTEVKVEGYINSVYKQIDFGKNKLAFDVFDKAYRGYLNLKNEGKLSANKNVITIADFSLSSTANRLWVIDLASKKVLFNTYVAHGQGSGNEYAMSFSNNAESHQSSLGFYVTGSTYCGKHGCSLRLDGMDKGFNDKAMSRDIVVHAADYVSNSYVCQNNRLGRSWGCPAVAPSLAQPIINTIKDGTCLFVYAPQQKYLQNGYWLNKKVANLPTEGSNSVAQN